MVDPFGPRPGEVAAPWRRFRGGHGPPTCDGEHTEIAAPRKRAPSAGARAPLTRSQGQAVSPLRTLASRWLMTHPRPPDPWPTRPHWSPPSTLASQLAACVRTSDLANGNRTEQQNRQGYPSDNLRHRGCAKHPHFPFTQACSLLLPFSVELCQPLEGRLFSLLQRLASRVGVRWAELVAGRASTMLCLRVLGGGLQGGMATRASSPCEGNLGGSRSRELARGGDCKTPPWSHRYRADASPESARGSGAPSRAGGHCTPGRISGECACV